VLGDERLFTVGHDEASGRVSGELPIEVELNPLAKAFRCAYTVLKRLHDIGDIGNTRVGAEDILQDGSTRPRKANQKNGPIYMNMTNVDIQNLAFIPSQESFNSLWSRRQREDELVLKGSA
jgi:hypothetical protein